VYVSKTQDQTNAKMYCQSSNRGSQNRPTKSKIKKQSAPPPNKQTNQPASQPANHATRLAASAACLRVQSINQQINPMMYFLLIQNTQGVTRLAKWWNVVLEHQDQLRIEAGPFFAVTILSPPPLPAAIRPNPFLINVFVVTTHYTLTNIVVFAWGNAPIKI